MTKPSRQKQFKLDWSGDVIGCTACSWSAPMKGRDIGSANQEFDEHVCAEHPKKKVVK